MADLIGTIEGLRDYAEARGRELPADDGIVSAALQRASDYITYEYLRRFTSAYDPMPPEVIDAVYEAAVLESLTPFFFSKTYEPGHEKVLVGVGDIRWQVIGSPGRRTVAPVSTVIEAMLRPFVSSLTVTTSTFMRA